MDTGDYASEVSSCRCVYSDVSNITFWEDFGPLSDAREKETAAHEVGALIWSRSRGYYGNGKREVFESLETMENKATLIVVGKKLSNLYQKYKPHTPK